jgi:tRNA-binding protein
MAPAPALQKSEIAFSTFQEVDMRVARVISVTWADGARYPSRVLELDLGGLGRRVSVGQYALVPEEELVGRNVVACVNLGERKMGRYVSQALVMGAPHPDGPHDQAQATPLYASDAAAPGDQIF